MTESASRRGTRRTTRRSQLDSDADGWSQASQSQTRVSASQASRLLSEDTLQKLTSSTIFYMLAADKKKIVITMAAIKRLVLKECARSFNQVFGEVKRELKLTFGLEVVELEGKRSGQYILINSLDVNKNQPHIVLPNVGDNCNRGFLTIVLATIFMNGNRITEKALWQALIPMGINPDVPHRTFGDVRNLLLKTFTSQLYIEYLQVPDSDPPVFEFVWGQRARAEVSKRHLLDFVCQVYTDTKPEMWTTQFEDANSRGN